MEDDKEKSPPPQEVVAEPQQEHKEDDIKVAANKKIDVLLKATGDAPIMRKKKWAVEGEKPVGWVTEFIRKYLKLDASDTLFVYVNQSFAPAPDQIIRNLYESFGSDGKLVLHYCKTQAWG
ncbi:ubiquitin-like protein ATG12 [Homarus americanus]|uniref:Ubiquitin-like protein ATG12 n=1 Tax=Homarus americanus TaxID=6706 RepID=A0A8J5K5G0_HOMAM|nr:ubiquitin-like protein ATG12 [Homarus americanus]KAG7171002.1 Ubiquitin-like protein ATG12-like [Homarus americanus]